MNWIDSFLIRHPQLRPYVDLVVLPPDYGEVCSRYPQAADDYDLRTQGNRLVLHAGEGRGLTVLAQYVICRQQRTSHRMSALLAVQKAPGIATTNTWWAGRPHFSQVYGEKYAGEVKRALARQGVNLAQGEYMPELARFKGDREAVVPFSGGRDYIKQLYERRRQAADRPPPKAIPLAEDIIKDRACAMVVENPDLKYKTKAELRERVLEKHGPPR